MTLDEFWTSRDPYIICECIEGMKSIPDNSIDLVLTDPPYGISFMGKDWDKAVPSVDVWKECLRVLKPGAFAFIMSGPRLDGLSMMAVNLSKAGFRIDFTPIYWTYATGFPKSMNISKAVDKKLGMKRTMVKVSGGLHNNPNLNDDNWSKINDVNARMQDNNPISDEAKALNGSYAGFQPKPAVEIVIVAMKPLSEKTYVDQAMKDGKGVTWLDDGRIPYASKSDIECLKAGGERRKKCKRKIDRTFGKGGIEGDKGMFDVGRGSNGYNDLKNGRFPANLLVCDDALNDGIERKSTGGKGETDTSKSFCGYADGHHPFHYDDTGSFSRYFDLDAWFDKRIDELPDSIKRTFPFLIVPKASKSEKETGLEHLPTKRKWLDGGVETGIKDRENIRTKNIHPTVKPVKLFSYLMTLGSRPGDIVLDPFLGSGTLLVAAKLMNRIGIGFEMNNEYEPIIRGRANLDVNSEVRT